MKKIHAFVGVLMVVLISACAKDFTTPLFSSKTIGHKKVAILPFEMAYTGRKIDKLSPEEEFKIREAEALAFQRSLHNFLLRQSGAGKKDIKIEFLTPERANRILADSGINPIWAYKETPERLCQVLGVSSVVKTKIEKEKFLTDLESFGLEIAGDILDKIKLPEGINVPIGANPDLRNRTYVIRTDCQLLNGEDASLLWKVMYDTETDWNWPANEVIYGITRICAKRFPYRNRSYYR